jgi:hypothetical protein
MPILFSNGLERPRKQIVVEEVSAKLTPFGLFLCLLDPSLVEYILEEYR